MKRKCTVCIHAMSSSQEDEIIEEPDGSENNFVSQSEPHQ